MTEDTQQAMADDLGVSEDTVRRAKEDAVDEGLLNLSGENLNTAEKRDQVREFVGDSIHIAHLCDLNIPSELATDDSGQKTHPPT